MLKVQAGFINADHTLMIEMPENIQTGPINIVIDQPEDDQTITIVISQISTGIEKATIDGAKQMRTLADYRAILASAHKLYIADSVSDDFYP